MKKQFVGLVYAAVIGMACVPITSHAGIFDAIQTLSNAGQVYEAINATKSANAAITAYDSQKNMGALHGRSHVYVIANDKLMEPEKVALLVRSVNEKLDGAKKEMQKAEEEHDDIDENGKAVLQQYQGFPVFSVLDDTSEIGPDDAKIEFYVREDEGMLDKVSGFMGQDHFNIKCVDADGNVIVEYQIDMPSDSETSDIDYLSSQMVALSMKKPEHQN